MMLTTTERNKRIFFIYDTIRRWQLINKWTHLWYEEILLWDVIEYANILVSLNTKNFDYTKEIRKVEKDILWYYIFYTKNLSEQDDDCIDYIYKLCRKDKRYNFSLSDYS